MKRISDSFTIGNMVINNRIVRSAVFELGGADKNGNITDFMKQIYQNLAAGGSGLIITGMFSACTNGSLIPAQVNVNSDSFVKNFREIADNAHSQGSKVVVQLAHCGAKSGFIAEGNRIAPSEITILPDKPAGEATEKEITKMAKEFGESAAKCKEAGADGVEIHAAHGYILSQFLSPFFNKRGDKYGGSIENRLRALFEVYDETRKQVGKDYPVLVRMNVTDLTEPSITLEEAEWVCKELQKRGVDAVELSGGLGNDGKTSPSRRVTEESQEGSFAKEAIEISKQVKIPVISIGGYRTPAVIEEWLNKGNLAAVSIGRPIIREADLAKRWLDGDTSKAACISCSKCYAPKDGKYGCQITG